jgi:hypothetical protein
MRRIVLLAIVIAVGAVSSGGARGQNDRAFGRIEGVAKDPDGAVLPGVNVTLTGGNAAARESITGVNGRFAFKDVPPGNGYAIRAVLPGFNTDRETSIAVVAGQTRTFELELRVRCINECVCVTGPISDVDRLLGTDAIVHVRVGVAGGDEHDGCGPTREAVVRSAARFGDRGERLGKTFRLMGAQEFGPSREYLLAVRVSGVKHPRAGATFIREVVRGRLRGEDAAEVGIRSGMPVGEAIARLREVLERNSRQQLIAK